jgi:hypothetical protein
LDGLIRRLVLPYKITKKHLIRDVELLPNVLYVQLILLLG